MFPQKSLCVAVMAAAFLTTGIARADIPASLAAYFEGDALKEAVVKLAPGNEPSIRRLDQTLSSASRFVKVEVVSIQAGGALVSVKAYSSDQIAEDTPSPLEHPFFVHGLPADLKEGAHWSGKVYPAGQYRYMAREQGEQVVNALAVSKEAALRAMERAQAK